ncbi:transglycosylase domain-containing protein [Desulfovibrio litoralis]|uniref:Transglycosylase n=1 Tax=Desulfovibrio litoralis DSM 11393 TaxID=1121455 RepID=A0A1M7THU3_9BACT|nr:transglycosylase domain-containing protein [Desulfovibrio litoralis]SHN70322.1 Transglycosylase [Desulfovibrio litoralis DSM 11393]
MQNKINSTIKKRFFFFTASCLSIGIFSLVALFIFLQTFTNQPISDDFQNYPINQKQIPGYLKNAFLVSDDAHNLDYLYVSYLNLHRNYPNKVLDEQRAFLYLALKLFMSKDDILTAYLNNAYFGDNAIGVEAAARIYFAKHVEELTLAEATFLVGLPSEYLFSHKPKRLVKVDLKSPIYSERIKQKQLDILKRMLFLDWISEAEYNQAVSQPLVYKSMLNRNKENSI